MSAVGPPKKKRYHHGNLRQALVEAAIALVGEEGPEAFQLRAVARRAGVSPAAPYRHFKDKADLLQAVAAEVARRLVETTDAEVARAGDDPLAQLRATGIAFVKFAVQYPAHFRVLNLPDARSRFDEHVMELSGGRDLMQEILESTEEAGQVAGNQAAVKLTARALIYGLARMIVDGHLGDELPSVEEAEQLAKTVTGVLGAGLRPR